MSIKCLEVKRENIQEYCIFPDGVKKKTGNSWTPDDKYAFKKVGDNCIITSNNCTAKNPTFGCNATCANKSNIYWNSYDVTWYGAWQNKQQQFSQVK
jgi:hypothetical protein